MKLLYTGIAFIVLCFIVGFAPPLLCWILFGILWVASIILGVISYSIFESEKSKKHLIATIIFLIVFLLGSKAMELTHCYNEMRKYFNERNISYNLRGVQINKSEFCRKSNFIFKVALDKYPDNVFHAGYCYTYSWMPSYNVQNDWYEIYLPYYLNIYNKENNTNISIEKKYYIERMDTFIIYNKENREEVRNFITYLIEKSPRLFYTICLYNSDANSYHYFNSWAKMDERYPYDY